MPFIVLAAAFLITVGSAQSNGKRLGKTDILHSYNRSIYAFPKR